MSEKDKEDREEQYQRTGEIPKCQLCKKHHWRYKTDTYKQCYKLKQLVEKYKELEDKGVVCSSDQEIHFPKYLNSDSKQNLDHSQKKWNRYKDPKYKKHCRCDYQIHEKIYDKLPQEIVGPWQFDSSSGKLTSLKKLARALSKGKEICKKSINREYIDKYSNQKVDLLNLAEKDDCIIKQRNKKPIAIVSKFNIFNSQDLFDNIFTGTKTYNREKRIKLHRRFSKSLAYTHGYMIRFTGQYLNRRVFFSIVSLENQKNHQP
ncbi:4286_t:CDS:2, partial [Gigaspora margarita]